MDDTDLVRTLDPLLGVGGLPLDLEEEARLRPQQIGEFYQLGFATVWEVQSQLATVVLVALVAFVSIWLALAVMIVWSLAATAIYYAGRRRGLPDLFESSLSRPQAGPGLWLRWLGRIGASLVRVWMAGLQAFVYSRTAGRVLLQPARCWRTRVARVAVLGVGLTLFGVAAAHHMLAKAGLPQDRVLKLSFVGPFLNVPYRILLSAIVVNAAMGLAGLLPA